MSILPEWQATCNGVQFCVSRSSAGAPRSSSNLAKGWAGRWRGVLYSQKNKSVFAGPFLFLCFSPYLLSSFWTSRGHRCRPSSPPVLAFSFYRANRVQQSHCSSTFYRALPTHALALSASQFVHKKKSLRIYASMHSGGLELTKPTYTRLEDNLICHRGDRILHTRYNAWHLGTFGVYPAQPARVLSPARPTGQAGITHAVPSPPCGTCLHFDPTQYFERFIRQICDSDAVPLKCGFV